MNRIVDTSSPVRRLDLKGEVYKAGFVTISEFADRLGIHVTVLSRILNGWDFPSSAIQRRMAAELGLTLRELRELL